MSKILSDSELVGMSIGSVPPALVLSILRLIIASFVLFIISPKLAFFALLSLPVYYIVFRKYSIILIMASSEERIAYSKVVASLKEG